MTDLLSSLMLPNSSQESFHSISSQPHTNSPPPSALKTASIAPTSPELQTSAFQAAGLPVYDIDVFLKENKPLHSTPASNNKFPAKDSSHSAASPVKPVSLGTKTSFYVAALNTQCQLKGFLPVFEIEGDASNADFGGVLKLRDVTITSDQRWNSKKDAREGLAEKGLKTVQGIEAKTKDPPTPSEPGKNWVGILHEFYNPPLGPIYNEYALGLGFACTVTIPSLPDQPLGSTTTGFPSKKAARTNAAKEAVEYLIEAGDLNPDGSTKARKKVKLGTAVRIKGKGLEVKKDTTYAQKVNDMCPLLGLAAPQYHLKPASALAPNMLSGYASFPNAPSMPTQIGEVRNVFGKKNAKEEAAKGVWVVLGELAARRNVRIDEREGHDSREGEDGSA